jgi:predicted RNase H-like HicB family nuclease
MTRRFLVVFEQGRENLSGYAPDVPGCGSTGSTLEDMRSNMREALEFHLEGLAADGDPIPEAVTTNVDFAQDASPTVQRYIVEWLDVQLPKRLAISA